MERNCRRHGRRRSRAYLDLAHLADLSLREVFWVTRAKDDLQSRVERRLQPERVGHILRDDAIRLRVGVSRKDYPECLRRVIALVEVDGQLREMIFLTNNFAWSAQTIADLYRCRWQIEVFFKELKQTLQLVDFLGHSAGAVKWQVWTALLAYLLLRFCAWLGQWSHSFTRLCFAPLGSVAKARIAQSFRKLWDSRWGRTLLSSTSTSVFGGI